MSSTIEQEKIFDACVESLRSKAAKMACVAQSFPDGFIGEKILTRFEWADWMKDNKDAILKSVNGGDL